MSSGSGTFKSTIKSLVPKGLWERLRDGARLRNFRDELRNFDAHQVRHTYDGVTLDVWLADPVAKDWYDCDWPAQNDIQFLRHSRLKPGARVFDVGAHQCVVAILLARIVGPQGSVVAVEANPHNTRIAEKNRQLNDASQLTVINAAIADKPGTILIDEVGLNCKVGEVAAVGKIEVQAITIDDLTAKHGQPDVVYIDVEGFECHALRGAQKTLAGLPDLVIEMHVGVGLEHFGGSVDTVLSLLPCDKYDLFYSLTGPDKYPTPFVPFAPGAPGTNSRFFLAAILKS